MTQFQAHSGSQRRVPTAATVEFARAISVDLCSLSPPHYLAVYRNLYSAVPWLTNLQYLPTANLHSVILSFSHSTNNEILTCGAGVHHKWMSIRIY